MVLGFCSDRSYLRKPFSIRSVIQFSVRRIQMKRINAVLVAAVLLGGVTLYAHHSFASTYDESKKVTVEGKLVQFLWRNPHSFVHIMAPDEQGSMQRWAVEW